MLDKSMPAARINPKFGRMVGRSKLEVWTRRTVGLSLEGGKGEGSVKRKRKKRAKSECQQEEFLERRRRRMRVDA